MTGFIHFHQELQSLRTSTAILESLDWDEEKFEAFLEELKLMLIAAPPNVDKALFWLRTTPWDTFDKQLIPDVVYRSLEVSFKAWEKKMKNDVSQSRLSGIWHESDLIRTTKNNKDDEWN